MQIQVSANIVEKNVGLLNCTLKLSISGSAQLSTVVVSLDDAKLLQEGDNYIVIISTL